VEPGAVKRRQQAGTDLHILGTEFRPTESRKI
jgi:hypothetical protein